MKKIVTVLAFALISSGTFAQFNQGRMLVGGGFNLSVSPNKTETGSTTTKNGTNTSFSLSPNFGYFVIDNLAVGAALGFSSNFYSYASSSSTYKSTSGSSVTLTPFVRYYLDPGIFFHVFAGGGGGTSKAKLRNPTPGLNDDPEKTGIFTWGLGAGYAWFLNDFVAVEPMLMYSGRSTKYKTPDPNYTSKYSGVSLNVGFQVYLGPRN
jgi:outer membrane protein